MVAVAVANFVAGTRRALLEQLGLVQFLEDGLQVGDRALELADAGELGGGVAFQTLELRLLRRLLGRHQGGNDVLDIKARVVAVDRRTVRHLASPRQLIDALSFQFQQTLKRRANSAQASALNSRLRASSSRSARRRASSEGICRMTSPEVESVTLTTTRPVESSRLKLRSRRMLWVNFSMEKPPPRPQRVAPCRPS